jgi:hypothetical protein
MSTSETPGQNLVAALSQQLGPHMSWDESELSTLQMIERTEDRRAVFAARFAEAAADPKASPTRLATLSGEMRLLDGAVHKWVASLDPHDSQAKSLRHVHAANQRWHRNSGA